MAHAQRLEGQMKVMQSRIKELESALKSQSNKDSVHPLLQKGSGSLDQAELYTFEPQEEDDIGEVTDSVDALSIGAGGKARYHGLTASSEVSILDKVSARTGLTGIFADHTRTHRTSCLLLCRLSLSPADIIFLRKETLCSISPILTT